ncbi:DUF3322 domain-containing protein [Desulfogranum mediterraneum]|uniref:DUF3322 domain-containing protein n=1 Tax=Desulfogranum mediterraneum TaxID=160661 RepID=UPI00040C99C5|nr:DUF3322 domain-containing protein [Desulfogranum mediterraneum]
MNAWTGTGDIRRKLEREWEQGKILAARLGGDSSYPRRIPLKGPQAGQWALEYDAARAWVAALSQGEEEGGFTLEWQEVNLRRLGRNRIPKALLFSSEESLLRFINKDKAATRFDLLSAQILAQFPELRSWLERRPLVALRHHREWPRLLAVIHYLKAHPHPGIYLRQLPIPEVDTKFMEQHRKLLAELLDLSLPPELIDRNATGAAGFCQRYGFLPKPVQLRFRLLDPRLYLHGLSDLQIPVTDFGRLELAVDQVFITENEINGLAFPEVERALIIFGLGFGLERLAGIDWLVDKKINYWGDIDSHGFVMLDQLRAAFPQARSLLMDRETLLAHRPLWGREKRPSRRELKRLTHGEEEVYQLLLHDQLAEALRLEQERIAFPAVVEALERLGAA